MSSVDQRVVEMQFKNSAFAEGVADTITALKKLQDALKLDGSSKGIQDAAKGIEDLGTKTGGLGSKFTDVFKSVQTATTGVAALGAEATDAGGKFTGISKGAHTAAGDVVTLGGEVSGLAGQFTAMQAIALGALASIGAGAVATAQQMISGLSIGPVSDGLSDYHEKLTSVQTIMNATGKSIEEVDGYFRQLDEYADKTIYNLSDMTSAFAKFTNAGVALDVSVPAIQGIANMTALAGQNAGAASIAMYNLSQSIAGGYLTRIDFKSLELANIATKEWKDYMIQAAVAADQLKANADGTYTMIGVGSDKALTANQLFIDGLQEGWATTDILLSVLGDYADITTDIGRKAMAAAQDVKSFPMMMDTLKAAVGTGWTDTFEILLGNVEEAKKLFTGLTLAIGGFLDGFGDARNEMLQGWKDLGGRDALIEGLKNAFQALGAVIKPIWEAFRSIFPRTTSSELATMTQKFRDFTATLMPSQQTVENLRRTFAGLFAVVGIVWSLIKEGVGFFFSLFGTITSGTSGILGFTGGLGDLLVALHDVIVGGEVFGKFFEWLGGLIEKPINGIKALVGWVASLFSMAKDAGATKSLDTLDDAMQGLANTGERLSNTWQMISDFFARMWEKAQPVIESIKSGIEDIAKIIGEKLGEIDFNDLLHLITTGAITAVLLTFRDMIGEIKDKIKGLFGGNDDSGGLKEFFSGVMEALHELTDTLQAMQNALNAGSLLAIAGAIALLTWAVIQLADIPADDLTKAVTAIGVMAAELVAAVKLLGGITTSSAFKVSLMGFGLLALAGAVSILASAAVELSEVDLEEMGNGLLGLFAILAMLVGVMKLMQNNQAKLFRTAAGLVVLAAAVKILASAVKDISDLDWNELARGLTGVGVLLLALGLFAKFADANKMGVLNGAGIVLIALGIKLLVDAVEDASDLEWDEIGRGLAVVAGGLTAIAIALKLMPEKSLLNAAAILIVAASLSLIGDAVEDMSKLDWGEIGRGLTVMAGALVAIAGSLRLMSKGSLFKAAAVLIVAYALQEIGEALEDVGKMDWDEIAKGGVALGVTLGAIALALRFIPTGAIFSAAAILVVVLALKVIAGVLDDLGKMSWGEIIKAVVVLGAALAIIGALISLVATGIGAVAISVFAISMVLIAASLWVLALALERLGNMSWSDIGAAIGALTLLFIVLAIGGVLSPLILALAIALDALAIAIALAGGGILAAGIGIQAFANAMQTLSQIDQDGMDRVIENCERLIALLPTLATTLADSIANFVTELSLRTPEMAAAAGAAVSAMAQEAAKRIPEVTDAFMRGLTDTLANIAKRMPELTTEGANAVVAFLNGLTKQMPKIGKAGAATVAAFLLAIGENTQTVVDAGFKMIIDVMNGIAEAIRDNADDMRAAARNIGSAIIEGISGGLTSGEGGLRTKMSNLANGLLSVGKNVLGINSPSKVFRDVVGMAIPEGIAVGIGKYGYMAENSVVTMGGNLLDAMGKTISGLGNMVNDMDDFNPVITPVLDLSAVQRGSAQIGDLLSASPIDFRNVTANAGDASAGYAANLEALAEVMAENSGSTVNMTQVNNSPKALSQADIYRNTNNQISRAKEALTNAN